MMPREIVFVASPLRGLEIAHQYLNECLRDSLARGEAPYAPHAIYPRILDDGIAEQRALGIECGLIYLALADRVAVYTDHGISEGMAAEIAAAEEWEIAIEYRALRRTPGMGL